MIRGLLTLISIASTIAFPWPFTVLLVLSTALFEPLLPLAVGIFADTLYLTSGWPLAALAGAFATVLAYLVRSRLDTSIIGG